MRFHYSVSRVENEHDDRTQFFGRPGRPTKNSSDGWRTKAWFWYLASESGRSLSAYALEKEAAGAFGYPFPHRRSCKFQKYRQGLHVPAERLVEIEERLHPGSRSWLCHPFWKAVDPRTSFTELAELAGTIPPIPGYWLLQSGLRFETVNAATSVLQQVATLDALTVTVCAARLRDADDDHRMTLHLLSASMCMLTRFLVQMPLHAFADDLLSFVASTLYFRGCASIDVLPEVATELRCRLKRYRGWVTTHDLCWPSASLEEQRRNLFWMEQSDPQLVAVAGQSGEAGMVARHALTEQIRLMTN